MKKIGLLVLLAGTVVLGSGCAHKITAAEKATCCNSMLGGQSAQDVLNALSQCKSELSQAQAEAQEAHKSFKQNMFK